jgi:SNF2 family DNA or RNA helicase
MEEITNQLNLKNIELDEYFKTLSEEELYLNLSLLDQYNEEPYHIIPLDIDNDKFTGLDMMEDFDQNENLPANINNKHLYLPDLDDEDEKVALEKIPEIELNLEAIMGDLPDTPNAKLLKMVYNKLNNFQKAILKECCQKKSGGLSLPLGSGKTIISLVLSLFLTINNKELILVVASKSLIASWCAEITKFFGDDLKFEVVHQSIIKSGLNMWKPNSDTQLILTTADVLSKFYKELNVDKEFIEQKFIHLNGGAYIKHFKKQSKPYLNHVIGGGIFYSLTWGCLIVDEAQVYTNIDTLRCQALGALVVNHRWLLSGTLFDEPKIERILGYHIVLNAPGKPRNLPDTKTLLLGNTENGIKIKSKFKGLNEHLVIRKTNQAFAPPKVYEEIVTHKLFPEEEKIYTMMRNILIEVKKKADIAKLAKNIDDLKRFSSYKMVMIMYLRQALICPLIPIASIAIDASDMEKKSDLSKIIMEEIRKLDIDAYLDDTESVKSSRIRASLKCLEKHKNEQVIVFSTFKSYLDIMEYFLPKTRQFFRMTAEMSLDARGKLIEDFRNTKNSILLMTYELGANGLNLQFAATVLLVDFWWNAARTQQAIGRIFRFGQLADQVNIYFFSANTGIEKIIFEKQSAKIQILNELKVGGQETKVPKINMENVIKMIELEDNKRLLKKIEYY